MKDYPIFSTVVDEFLEFVGDATLVAHNASFDMNFINYQLKHGGFPVLKNKVIDTLVMARTKFPGAPATLDALCRRYEIDNSNRTLHGALLDSELLAEVYLELIGGRQRNFGLNKDQDQNDSTETSNLSLVTKKAKRDARHFDIPQEELEAHEKMLEDKLKDSVWAKIMG